MADLWHSWGNNPKQKAREKEYNHWYYEKFKDQILRRRKTLKDLVERDSIHEHPRDGKNDYDYDFDRWSANTGRKDSFGYDNAIGVERFKFKNNKTGERKNTLSLNYYNSDFSDPNGEVKPLKRGAVTIYGSDDGLEIEFDLDYGRKKLTELGSSIISTGKSIINKLRGGR